MKNETILVIGADPALEGLSPEQLRREGYSVSHSPTVESAIQLALQQPFNLYLMDAQTPGMRGLDLLERIKELQPEASVILVTEVLSNETLLRALQLGVRGFLFKPFDLKNLLQITRKILEEDRSLRSKIHFHVLNPLFEISEAFLSEIDLQDTLKRIVEIAREETRADWATLMLADPKTNTLASSVSTGTLAALKPSEIEGMEREIFDWVTTHKEPYIKVEGLDPHPWALKGIANHEIGSSICTPMLRKEKAIGVLCLSKKSRAPSFTQNDLGLATVLCRQAAVLIDNVRLFDEVNRKALALEEAQFDAIKALAEALETKDAYTRDHSDRALLHAVAVAEKMGLSDRQKERLKYAAILHDIGKIGVPEHILNKPSKLTPEEQAVMKTHPEKGAEIIKHIKSLADIVELVLHHHEGYDGTGYPGGLAGEQIPIESRIVSVLDAFDAMTSDRVYRKAPGRQRAVEQLRRYAGTQFDPRVVEAFLEVIAESGPHDAAEKT